MTEFDTVIDGIQFPAPSACHAIDQAFMAVHALHASYQEQSLTVWLLLQKVVYELDTKWDPKCSVVET